MEQSRRHRIRTDVGSAALVNCTAGLWLVVSPWVADYAGAEPMWLPISLGTAILSVALLRFALAWQASWVSALNAVLGLIVLLSALSAYETEAGRWSSIMAGAVVFMFSIWSVTATESQDTIDRRLGGRLPR